MGSQGLTSERLDGLCSQDQLDLLNAIDSLRSQDIRHFISLPQIIVCGDQSSGKSSVLEAISGVSFPVKSDTATRFPTELILRKSDHISVTISISPHQSRTESEKRRLKDFQGRLTTFEDVHGLVNSAQEFMGVNANGKGFSNDLLRIEVSGPDRPHLTIVDLPGLIHSVSKSESADDVHLIHDVVKGYMEEPRSIILAVVSAKNDYKNQRVLSLAQVADRSGSRTLGVITKPDTLARGSGSEGTYLNLARNSHVELRLGWHVLRNRDSETEMHGAALTNRDAAEETFFSESAWSSLPAQQRGIKALRIRLSDLLLRQISAELPNLMREMAEMITTTQRQLDKLGQPRSTVSEQRFYLTQLSQDFQSLVQAARSGTYDHTFFGDAMTEDGYSNRIRALVQNLNQKFSKNLNAKGSRYKVVEYIVLNGDHDQSDGPGDAPQSFPIHISREEYVSKITRLLERTRGRELPGLFNPMIVDTLFKEQSSPWEKLAAQHVREVIAAARRFVQHTIDHVSDSETADGLLRLLIAPKMEKLSQGAENELARLLEPHLVGHGITYNHYLTQTLQKIRSEREDKRVQGVISSLFEDGFSGLKLRDGLRMDELKGTIRVNGADSDMDRFAASEALDYMTAYYKVARKRFVDDLAVEVIERSVVNKLQDMFSVRDVEDMTQGTIELIAGETEQCRQARDSLTRKLQVLRAGWKTCRKFADFRLTDDIATSRSTTGGFNHQQNVTAESPQEIFPISVAASDGSETDVPNPLPEAIPAADYTPRAVSPIWEETAPSTEEIGFDEPPRPVKRGLKKKKKISAKDPSPGFADE